MDLDQSLGDEEEEAMFSAHKSLLLSSINHLANMDTEKIITQLRKRGLLDNHDCEMINHEKTAFDMNSMIIDKLLGRGEAAFDTFFKILSSVDVASAEKLLPVQYRILWFTSSPKYAAAVAYALEKYFDCDALLKTEGRKPHDSYLLQRGRIFKRDIPTEILNSNADENCDQVRLAQDVELYLAFPRSERGNTPRKALRDVFQALGSNMTVAILSGVCVGVRGDGGEVTEVKGGEVVLAIDAVSLDSRKRELPLSSALIEAKASLSQLPEENKEWFGEAKGKLKELDRASGFPNREHPRLVPHFDTIRQDVQATPTETRLPRALASDSDTLLFYDLCAHHLGVERPWFSCKGVIDPAMLNNVDPAHDPGSVCALTSTFFAMEACKTIVDKLRQSSQTFSTRSE